MGVQRINAPSAREKLYVEVPCLLPHRALCGQRKWRHEGGDPDNSMRCVALVRAEAKSSCWLYLSPTRALSARDAAVGLLRQRNTVVVNSKQECEMLHIIVLMEKFCVC